MSQSTLKKIFTLAHMQWYFLNETSTFSIHHKARSYDLASELGPKNVPPDSKNNCFFCDYDLHQKGRCRSCPAKGLWTKTSCKTPCLAEDSPYKEWKRTGNAKPMLDLIQEAAEMHGIDIWEKDYEPKE